MKFLKNRIKFVTIFSFIILLVSFLITINLPDNKLHIVFCDVGQGDGILIKTPKGNLIVIDAGYDNKMKRCIEKNTPFYNKHISLAIISHLHADHIAGFIPLMGSHKIDRILLNKLEYDTPEHRELTSQSKAKKQLSQGVWATDKINYNKVELDVLWPMVNSWNRSNGNWQAYLDDLNDTSTVLLLTYHNIQVLFTGDANISTMDKVVESPLFSSKLKQNSIRILKYPHHGSRLSLSSKMLTVFKSPIAVISLGKKNTYGHPHKEVLDALKMHKFKVLRTDELGSIEFITDGIKLWQAK
ncbi:MAG: MBL fold metallo-hydrolase [bacterium]|nr:MBL fold metallo-hydrolase [bacterium]